MSRLFLGLLVALTLAACGRDDPIVTGEVRPAIWEARGETGGRLLLFGSIHQLPPRLDWMTGRVRLAAQDADELLLEISPEDIAAVPALFARISRDETVPPLDIRLGAGPAEDVRDLASDMGVRADDADAIESWALAMAAGNALARRAGLSGDNGVETRLTTLFRAAGKPVTGLERAAAQLALFDDLPPATQDIMLRTTAERAADARERAHDLIRAWARGDTRTIAEIAAEDLARTPGLAEPLVHARNRAWVDQLHARLGRPGTALVAVGAGHLVGERSVIDLLEERGVTVRRVQ